MENNIIKFQSDLDFEETQNIEQYILDWDTIVNDSKYAYDGSVRLQSKFFDNVDYTVEYNVSTGSLSDYSEPTLLESGVRNGFIKLQGGNEQFLTNSRTIANLIEESYLYNSGIVMNVHPITNTVNIDENTLTK